MLNPALTVIATLSLIGTSLAATTAPLAITGATIIDGTGRPPIENGVIIIVQDKIVAVGDKHTPMPDNATRLAAQGKTIIPGLMDANVHLFATTSPPLLLEYRDRYEAVIAESAQIALKQGVTTVFDSWGPRQALVNVRNAINAGNIPGSRIYLAGNIVGFDGPLSADFDAPAVLPAAFNAELSQQTNQQWTQGVGSDLLAMTPAMVREKVRDYVQQDIDFLTYGAGGHGYTQALFLTFSPAVHQVLVSEARQAKLVVQANTNTVEGLRLATEAGVDILHHCDITGPVPSPLATLQRIKAQGIFCAPSARTAQRTAYLNQVLASYPPRVSRQFAVMDQNASNMIDVGVRFLLSTYGGVAKPGAARGPLGSGEDQLHRLGEGHINWLKAMVEKGLPPMDALMAATHNIAKAFNKDAELGTLEVGKTADLVILDKNPLDNPEYYRLVHQVIHKGQMVNRDQLPLQPLVSVVAVENNEK